MLNMIKNLFLKMNRHLDTEDIQSGCKNAQKVGRKYGYIIVCPEDEEEIQVTMTDENCEKAKKVASKYGFTIVCDEEQL